MKLLRKILATSLAIFALPSAAVSFSTPVAEEDYQNHIIHFLAKGNNVGAQLKTCSGMLMGGKYLLTASHCLDSEVGEEVEVEIFQGVNRLNPTASHKRTGVAQHARRSFEAKLAWQYYLRGMMEKWIGPSYPLAFLGGEDDRYSALWWLKDLDGFIEFLLGQSQEDQQNPMMQNHNQNDFGMLVLDFVVPHHTGHLISPLVNMDTGEEYLSDTDHFIFRGYGQDDRQTGMPSETLKEGTFRMYRPYLKSHALVSNGFPDIGEDRLAMCEPSSAECYFRPQSLIDVVGIDTGLGYPASLPGDSGAAITHGDYYYGSMYGGDRDPIDGKYISVFSDVGYLMGWIANAIDEVVVPSDIGVSIEEGDDQAHEIKIPVQNFTQEVLVVGSASVQSSEFSVLEDCTGVLDTTDGCMITVLFNGNSNPVNAEVSSVINLGFSGADALPLSVRFKVDDTIETPDYPDFSCDDDPYYPGCYNICEIDWYAPGCPPVECSVDPYQDKCVDVCELNPDADECTDSAPTNPDSGNTIDGSGDSGARDH